MKPKQLIKIVLDPAMTAILLLLTAYSLVGEEAHEWLGVGMFVLFVLHHLLNGKWICNLFKGRYTPYRILQTVLVLLAFVSMSGSMISGIVLSRHVFDLNIRGFTSIAKTAHMLCAYWGFAFLSLHLGLHWSMMTGMAGRMRGKPSAARARGVRVAGFLIAGYGVYAFIRREIGSYMLLKSHFVFFDFDEPLIFFLLDYVAVMALFVFAGHYLTEALKRIGRKKQAVIPENKEKE